MHNKYVLLYVIIIDICSERLRILSCLAQGMLPALVGGRCLPVYLNSNWRGALSAVAVTALPTFPFICYFSI